ncbi:hypothetical protein JCM11251_000305 [Rhodosporidiobolus azoricus]
MPRSSAANLECAICLDSRAPDEAKEKGWVAITSCGHVFHTDCLARYRYPAPRSSNDPQFSRCPNRCPDRGVAYPRSLNSHRDSRIPMPVLPLFPNVASDDPSSEGDFEASQALFAPPALDDDDPIVDEDEAAAEEREGEGEVERLKRELRETRNTVREQRAELERLSADHDTLRQQASTLETTIAERNEVIEELQEQLDEVVTPKDALERVEQLELELKELRVQQKEARTTLKKLQLKYTSVKGDWHKDCMEWEKERGKLTQELAQAGESGADKIKVLEEMLADRKKQIEHLQKAAQDAEGERLKLEALLKGAKELVQEEQQKAQEKVLKARETSQKQVDDQKRRIRALEGGLAEYKVKNKKLHHKVSKLKAKKSLVPDDENEDDDNDDDYLIAAAPPSPAKATASSRRFARSASATSTTGRAFLRTTSRSRNSPSPFNFAAGYSDDDLYGPVPVVNNNSTLLASPSKRKRQRSVMDEHAWDVSAERGGQGALDQGAGAVDEEMAEEMDTEEEPDTEEEAAEEAGNGEQDSDIEIIEPARAKGKGTERACTSSFGPLTSSSHVNAFPPTSSAPPGRSTAFTTLSGYSTTSSAFASQPIAGGWGASGRKPVLAELKTDKHLPPFLRGAGGGKQATLDFAPKKKPKIGRK